MLPVRVSQSLNLQSGAITVLVFHTVVFFSLIHSCKGQPQVVGPSQPIVAMVGEDVILPCHLDPVMDAFGWTVEWGRPDLDPRFVLVWRDGVELESKKHPSYEGRTSLFTDQLKQGNISLKLSKVKLSDKGSFRLFIPQLGETAVQLVVGSVSSPDIQKTKNGSSVILQCESKGWYPEPEVVWLDGEGNLLSAGRTKTVRGPDDLYTVSSRVTVEKRHSNNFTCRVQQKDINQTRETHINVPDEVFEGPSGSSSSAPTIIGSVVGIILLVLAVVFGVWKWRQNKIRNKKHHEDEETLRVREKKSNCISNNSEQESLMGRETDRGQLTAERETTNNVRDRQTENNLQTEEEEEEKIKPTDDETEERETLNDKEKPNKLKAKEREVKEFEKKVSRVKTQIKDKEEQINQVKEQLEEVERQREQTERKLQSVNREEDQMDPETQKEAAEKHEAVLEDLERKKAELQKQLEKIQRQLEAIKSSESVMTQKIMKATKEKEEIIKTLSQSDSEEDL